ncbi:bifunctional nicotinamidase/pyrazinamidase [Silvimonas sp. JCM 19000]
MPRTELLIIDPQNDFCDQPDAALPVPGAMADLGRLAQLIEQYGSALEGITVTLDSHHLYDIAHPAYWQDAHGHAPAPFTGITLQDIDHGHWRPRRTDKLAYVRDYLAAVPLLIWPPHCLVGTWGHGIPDVLRAALDAYEQTTLTPVNYQFKGLNPDTEHFSAYEADLPLADDVQTQFNPAQTQRLRAADVILVGGEALSHCVASSVRTLVKHLGPDFARKLVLLTDCASPVTGFEAQGQIFLQDMAALGARLCRSTEWLAAQHV